MDDLGRPAAGAAPVPVRGPGGALVRLQRALRDAPPRPRRWCSTGPPTGAGTTTTSPISRPALSATHRAGESDRHAPHGAQGARQPRSTRRRAPVRADRHDSTEDPDPCRLGPRPVALRALHPRRHDGVQPQSTWSTGAGMYDTSGYCIRPGELWTWQKCWYNVITLLKSTNGGATFSHASPPPTHFVGGLPYRYAVGDRPVRLLQPEQHRPRAGRLLLHDRARRALRPPGEGRVPVAHAGPLGPEVVAGVERVRASPSGSSIPT